MYKGIPGCDVWDEDRDAMTWTGGLPVVAHPPCRAWGRLSHMAKPRTGEKDLARFAVDMVRAYGGVLEHPAWSKLWQDKNLPHPGTMDSYGGFTMPVHQHWWGHKAEKSTWLYIVGCAPRDLPAFPFRIDYPTHVIASRSRLRPETTKADRERTPPELAQWLVDLAKRCGQPTTTRI